MIIRHDVHSNEFGNGSVNILYPPPTLFNLIRSRIAAPFLWLAHLIGVSQYNKQTGSATYIGRGVLGYIRAYAAGTLVVIAMFITGIHYAVKTDE